MATSGSFEVEFTSIHAYVFSWKLLSQSVEENTSQIEWWLSLSQDYYGENYDLSSVIQETATVTINGNVYELGCSSTKSLHGTETIKHNSDGNKTFSFSFSRYACADSVYVDGAWTGIGEWVTGSGTGVLPKITRSASLTVSNGTLGVQQYIGISRDASGLLCTIKYKCGSASGTIATKTAESSVTFTPPLTLAAQNIEGESVQITYSVTAYDGSTSVGSNSISITCGIPDSVVPTLSMAVADYMGYESTFGKYVQGCSKLSIDLDAAGAYGSRIKAYKITADGRTYTRASVVTDTVKGSGDLEIVSTITDSRGRTATAKTTISVYAYTAPTVTEMSVMRTENAQDALKENLRTTVIDNKRFDISTFLPTLVYPNDCIVKGRSNITGGRLYIDFDPQKCKRFECTVFLFDSEMNPYAWLAAKTPLEDGSMIDAMERMEGTDSNNIVIAGGDYDFVIWTPPKSGSGRILPDAPFSIPIPEGCYVIVEIYPFGAVFPDGTVTDKYTIGAGNSYVINWGENGGFRARMQYDPSKGDGANLAVTFSAAVTPLENKNSASYTLRYKKITDDIYTEIALSDYTGKYSVVDAVHIFSADVDSSYEVEIVVSDSFGIVRRVSGGSTLAKLFSIITYGAQGIALGKYAELEGVLDVGFVTRFSGGIMHPTLEDNISLDDIMTPNTYIGKNTVTAGYYNCPHETDDPFTLEVLPAGTEGHLIQRVTVCNNMSMAVYTRAYCFETWGAWQTVYAQ